MQPTLVQNYKQIIKNILSYLPSRFLIILNSILIIPLLSKSVDYNEMSIYLIAVQILNLVCTCSSDALGKIVLRFYDKYKLQNKLDVLSSNVFALAIISYAVVWILYYFFHEVISTKFAIPNQVLLLTLFIVIPCGIRQIIYQYLRLKQNSKLYTFSIIGYQILFVLLFLIFTGIIPCAISILTAMMIAVIATDIMIVLITKPKLNLSVHFDKAVLNEILQYSLPLFFTNVSYWFILNISKFIFQNQQQYSYTSIAGITWTFANWIIQPLVTVFIFSAFPVLVEKFELKNKISKYFTNLIQFYCLLFIPFGSMLCFLSNDIINTILPETYKQAAILFPYYAISICLHEFTKLINIKYHLKNKIYLELIFAIFTALLTICINIYAIKYLGLFGAAIALLISELLLLLLNFFVKFKHMEYVKYSKILKTVLYVTIISIVLANLVTLPFNNLNSITIWIEILLYLTLNYSICYLLKNKILS